MTSWLMLIIRNVTKHSRIPNKFCCLKNIFEFQIEANFYTERALPVLQRAQTDLRQHLRLIKD